MINLVIDSDEPFYCQCGQLLAVEMEVIGDGSNLISRNGDQKCIKLYYSLYSVVIGWEVWLNS